MGVRLIVEVLDFAPANLTPRERWALVVMAEGARDTTRVCWPGVENDERFIRRCRLSRSQRYAVIKALIEKGALENVRRGQKHVRASYRIAAMAPAEAVLPEPQDAPEESEVPDSQGPGLQDAETPAPGAQRPDSQDAENQDFDSQRPGSESSASRFTDLSVPDYRTPSPQSPQSPQPKEEADASGAAPDEGPVQEAFFTDEATAKREAEKALNRRVNKLARHYCDLIKTADWHKTTSAVRLAITAEVGTDAEIEAALAAIATDGRWAPTADNIRIEINQTKSRNGLRVVGGTGAAQPTSGARAPIATHEQWASGEVTFRI